MRGGSGRGVRAALVLGLGIATLALGLGCTPARLDETTVTGADGSLGTSSADTSSGDTSSGDPADAGDGPVDASGADAADAQAKCQTTADCPKADACQQALCVAGKCSTTPLSTGKCDDGEPCTLGDACQAGACKAGAGWDAVACACHPDPSYARACPDDGNLCNGQAVCTKSGSGYSCKAGPAPEPCPDADPTDCVTSACDPKTGLCVKANVKKGTACAAGFPAAWTCVVNQACDGQGTCEFQNLCECMGDGDCAAKDDDSACNGTLFCNKDPKATGPKCQINPKTVVTCNANNDTACLKNACAKATGKCAMLPTETVKQICDDKNGPCWWYPLEATDPKPAVVACSDGLACSLNDECKAGKCVSQTNACTCTSDAECMAIEPWASLNDLCRGKPYCDKSDSAAPVCKLNPATVPQCAANLDTACAKNVCVPTSGKCEVRPRSHVYKRKCGTDPAKGCSVCDDGDAGCEWALLPQGQAPWTGYDKLKCDDGDACTASESCTGGQCLSTNWLCGCSKDADCSDDGDLCNGIPYCDKAVGKCKTNPASVVTCSSVHDSDCAKNTCVAATGKCALTPVLGKAIPCSDGDACTASDVCENGKCVPGTNICPCQTNADCAAKEDDDVCNGTLYCDKTANPPACAVNPATVITCPKGLDTPCRANQCDAKTGACALTPIHEGLACSDGNPCTAGDVCIAGSCQPSAFTCDCTSNADCASKEDGDLCNGTLFCNLGKCQINPATVVKCPAGATTPCQSVQCDAKTGQCAVKPVLGLFVPCDDGNPCTKGDTCEAGSCAAGSNLCACLQDSQCAPLDDGNPCNGELFCDTSAVPFACQTKPATAIQCNPASDTECQKSVCDAATATCQPKSMPWLCNDANPCTLDACNQSGACAFVPVQDGASCGGGGTCSAGQCQAP